MTSLTSVAAIALVLASSWPAPLHALQAPAMPTDGSAILVKKIDTDERVVLARLAAIAKRRRQELIGERKTADRLYGRLPKPPRGQAAVAHLDPARAPIEAARSEIDRWKGVLGAEEQMVLMLEDSRNDPASIVVLVVQQAVHNSQQLVQGYSSARAAAAAVAAGEQLGKPKDEMNLRRITADARLGRFNAMHRLQGAYEELLTALEQGGPSEYQARFDAWMEAGRMAARRREMQWQAYERQFAALMAEVFFGLPAAAAAAVEHRYQKSVAEKFADPDYKTIMDQTRQAYREACEADGGVFVDGTGDDPGTCRAR